MSMRLFKGFKPRKPGEPPTLTGPQRFGMGAWAGWAFLAVIFVIDVRVFAWLGVSYPLWYLTNGALFAFGVTMLSVVGIELDAGQDLISPHPLYYLVGWIRVAFAWTEVFNPTQEPAKLPAIGARPERADRAISRVVLVLARVGMIGWFLVAGPPQYLLNVVCGAPARAAVGSGLVVWEWEERSADDSVVGVNTKTHGPDDRKPNKTARRVGWDLKPVSATYALGGFVVFLVARLTGL